MIVSSARGTRSRTFKAEHEGICWGCLDDVLIGDEVVFEEGEIVHSGCTLDPDIELEEVWVD